MAKYLFDTDVLINLLHGDPDTVQALTRLAPADETFFSVITEAELYAGLAEHDTPEAEPVKAILSAMIRVPVDGDIARQAGRYRNRYGRQCGTGLPDALIAATAKALEALLVTENIRHFPMPEVRAMTAAQLRVFLGDKEVTQP